MKPVSVGAPAVAPFTELSSQLGKQLFQAATQVSLFFESVASRLNLPAAGMLDQPAGQTQVATPAAAQTPLAQTQVALQGGARAYGAPHPNVRFAAGTNAHDTFFMVTDIALPQGLHTDWNDYVAAKANRPDPSTYLEPAYIAEHLAQFHDGAVTFLTTGQFDRFTVDGNKSAYHGRPEGLFVMPAKCAMQIIEQAQTHESVRNVANGEDQAAEKNKAMLRVVEEKMGIPTGLWSNGQKLLAVFIENPRELNLRMVTGREGGANIEWRPGGYTTGGTPEAMVDKAGLHQAFAIPFAALPEFITDRELTA